ncbi:hypothetical protein DQ237_12020 [Blastococcus sp. TF02-8]|uniref:PA14 domain-containing protein n=1 Tax=Blastococcus sp. TF02-8 TaxID=2250574 RepID=UPI000E0185A7|nr:PA14 domain-containing protein [Blastococcus sp. TF02-8]RBY95864.1 hypothetical protein DQ237_12020 [Blastococcus sp. TF02-8]
MDQAAQAAPKSSAVKVRELPALASARAGSPTRQEAVTPADFAPLTKRQSEPSSFDPAKSKVSERTEYATLYDNPDGTQTYQQSTEPLNVKDKQGAWQPIDVALAADPSGRAAAAKHPLHPSFAATADDPAAVRVEVGNNSIALGLENAEHGRKIRVNGAKADYQDVAGSTDLRYEVTPGSVKETIVLDKAPDGGQASWRFILESKGLTPRLAEGGVVELVAADGSVPMVMPAIETWDSAGAGKAEPATTGGTYALERVGQKWALTVSVDEAWLRAPERVYPVSVDPTFTYNTVDSRVYRSTGYTCVNCGVKIGNSLGGTTTSPDSYNRTAIKFDNTALFGQNVVGAKIDVARINPTTFQKAWEARVHSATALAYTGVGQQLASGVVGDVGTFSGAALTTFIRDKVNARDNGAYLMMVGTETPGVGTYKNLTATLTVDVGSAAPAPVMAAPADNSVITSLTPTLSVNPVADPDGEAVSYCFRVATGSDGKTGTVVDSGCLPSPSWTVPAGVLADGVAYTWTASSYSGITMNTGTAVGHFKVDQRIGNHGPAPVDNLGPVQVNLANGNVTTSAASPSFTTVGGSAGLNLTYNSQQPLNTGLTASYYDDPSHAGLINDNFQKPVLVRTEPQVNADWGSASPFPPILGGDWWLARWQGYFVPPVTGTYQFAGLHDDSGEVVINGTSVYAVTTPTSTLNWAAAKSVQLTAGEPVPITVEQEEMTGAASMKLFVRTTAGGAVPEQLVPSTWLATSDSPALPQGWTLSADLDGSGAMYTEALIADQSVVLTDASGAKHTWTRTNGSYAPPAGEDGVLALDSSGRVTITEGGQVSTFRTDGKLDTLTSVLDSRKPAALQNVYSGTPSRLTQIKDPVSGRAHTLSYNRAGDDCYGGALVPPGFDPTPPGRMLCRITYWDGSQTRYWYSQGRLARIEDPGGELTDYAYDGQGLLTGVRDNLGADWVAADPAGHPAADATTTIAYTSVNGKPAAQSVTGPKPSTTQDRPQRSYRYDRAARTTFVDVAGLTPASGFASKVVVDDADRLLSTTDATGRSTSQTWNVKDMQLTSTDAAGRVSTTIYDDRDRPIASYGPAPASCFTGQTPTSACAGTVPQTRTAYDEGLLGLAAALYDNTSLTGAPKVFQTGLGTTDGRLRGDWTATTAPAAGIPASAWSARLTGDIAFPAAGNYTLEVEVDGGARLWIDDALIADSWTDGAMRPISGAYANSAAGARHRIRVDYFNGSGAAAVHLNWRRPDSVYEPVPGASLQPSYGLVTSSTQAESAGVPDKTTTTRYGDNGLDAGYGLVTSSTTGGITSGTKFEPVGSGYLRPTAKVMPSGVQTTYTAYGDTEQRDNPCTSAVDPANQGGMSKLSTLPTPATGQARTDEQVYDASGRVVARATSGGWECTSYDARSRVTRQTYPGVNGAGERVVTTDYAVGGDPLKTSVQDNAGTITTEVDLLGRVVRYTDALGVVTETSYDRAGRPTSEKVTPPNGAVQVSTYSVDDAGRLLTTVLDGVTLATVTYDAAGELGSVAYSNGSRLAAIGRDGAGAVVSQSWRTADGRDVVSAVTRTRAGTVVDESLGGVDARPGGANFGYDAAGRLTDAWVTGHHYGYDFTSPADAACPFGTRGNAGVNTNRVAMRDETPAGTQVTRYCYDDADRLLVTLGATAITGVKYDDKGSTTAYTQDGVTTALTWDGAARNTGLSVGGPDPANVAYLRDATDRIIRRTTTAGDSADEVRYGYSAGGDTADLAFDGAMTLLTRSVSLPGGVLFTWKPDAAARTWDHPTIRGDLSLTTDASGVQVGELRTYGPFGETLTSVGDGAANNQPGQMDYGWLGQHQRPFEHAGALAIVEMGARPYSPLLGRFFAVDPVDGGSANDYEYTAANPINNLDLDGRRNEAFGGGGGARGGGTICCLPPRGGGAAAPSRGGAAPVRTGQWAQVRVPGAQNKVALKAPSGRMRIPDRLQGRNVGEIKNTSRLYNSSQFRDYLDIARARGGTLTIWHRGIVSASPQFMRWVNENGVILKVIPGT